ncbi:P-loop containing nucleoside triphosphate hydrolase [Tanacetum coccineum]
MPRRVDPLHIELEQLSSVKEKMIKSYHDCIQKINIDCEKEIAEAIAEIRLKYHNKRQEADATFNSRKKEVESNMSDDKFSQMLNQFESQPEYGGGSGSGGCGDDEPGDDEDGGEDEDDS